MTEISARHLAGLLDGWRGTSGPAYDALATTVARLLADGRLPLLARLPSERELALALNLSRTTVAAAYARLRDLGWLQSRRGAGSTTVLPPPGATPTTIANAGAVLDLAVAALPAPAPFAELAVAAARRLPAWLGTTGYHPVGLPPLRAAIADRLTARGLPTTPEQVVVTSGALHALDLVARVLLRPGDPVLVESATYPASIEVLRGVGARLSSFGITGAGWDLEVMRAAVKRLGPRLVYAIPDFQNPTGALIGADQRQALVLAAARAGAHVVIDETFAELALDGQAVPPPVGSYDDDGRVVTLGSAGKAFWGGMRVGWVRAAPALVRRLAAARAASDIASPVLEQLLAVEVFGVADALIADRRSLLRERRAALLAALGEQLPAWSVEVPGGGMSLWAELPGPDASTLAAAAAGVGVRLAPGPRFSPDGLLERRVRLPFTLAPDELRDAVGRLAVLDPARAATDAPPAYVA